MGADAGIVAEELGMAGLHDPIANSTPVPGVLSRPGNRILPPEVKPGRGWLTIRWRKPADDQRRHRHVPFAEPTDANTECGHGESDLADPLPRPPIE